MDHADAVALIQGGVAGNQPAVWADLGCGDGTFTLALASLLPASSIVHAVDVDAAAPRRLPRFHGDVSIVPHVADFTRTHWPFAPVDGVLMANSLHDVADQAGFLRACAGSMSAPRQFVIVEYDTDLGHRWVPYPVSRAALRRLFPAGRWAVQWLGTRPSVYRRAAIYAAAVVERE